MILAIKQFEVAGILYNEAYNMSIKKMEEGIHTVKNGFYELKKELLNDSEKEDTSYDTIKLKNDLLKISKILKNVNINVVVYFKGYFILLKKNTFQAIKRLCQESITNAVKHGNANQIIVTIRVDKNDIQISIIDNGKGCNEVVKGNGLSSMEQRIIEIGGNVKYNFEENSGFQVKATISL